MVPASFFVAPRKRGAPGLRPPDPPLWMPASAGMTVRKGGVPNVRKPSSRPLLLLCWRLGLCRLALCRLICCRRSAAPLVAPFDASSAPLLTPLHAGGAGGLGLSVCEWNGKGQRRRQSQKRDHPSTRDHSRFNFGSHLQSLRFRQRGNLGLALACSADPNQTSARAEAGSLASTKIADDNSAPGFRSSRCEY